MNYSEIQFTFLDPGEWKKIIFIPVSFDQKGFGLQNIYTQDDIPAEYAAALVSVMNTFVSMAAPWQASRAWARLRYRLDEYSGGQMEVIELSIEAVNDEGGRRIFTSADYPQFVVCSADAVRFYKFFIGEENE